MANPQAAAAPGNRFRGTYNITAAGNDAFDINENLGPLTSLRTFDIRNGEVSEARSLLVKPTIAAAWHWRPIEGLEPTLATRYVGAYVRTYRCALSGLPATAYPDDLKAKLALILGVSRAVSTELYCIENADLIPGETAPALLKAVRTGDGPIRFEPTAVTTPEEKLNLAGNYDTSDETRAVISSIHMSSIGLLPLQGYSLIMTGHHYLSDKSSQSYKAYLVVERQFWVSTAVKTWWDANTDVLRDVLFHKSGHPVSISLKQSLAMDPDVAKKIKIAGAGSAAARLPAVETQVRTASSYLTLLQTVRTLFDTYGGYLNYVVLDEALAAVNLFPPNTLVNKEDLALPYTCAPWVDSRDQALNYLGQVMRGHEDTIAYCFGFYVALSDANQAATGTAGKDTLRTAYSLMKLETQSTASFVAGREAYGDYAACKRRQRAEGTYKLPTFIFTGGRPLPRDQVPSGIGTTAPPIVYTAGEP